jgi:acyl-CoA synthetase (NDP forming)/GNAT superfamily N-acetyltransferase
MFRIITEGVDFREYVLLRDGQSLLLRMARPEDVPAVEALMSRVSRQSLQMRFMGGVAMVPRSFVEQLCSGDPKERACMLAVTGEGDAAQVVGTGNYVGLGARNIAEVAFLVDDAWQGRGISTLLLERLAGIACANGFVGFEAEVLFENQRMLNVFRDSGFQTRQALDGGSIHLEFPVSGAAALRERAEVRERIATANSMARMFRPKAVAVVGASRDPASVGGMIFHHLLHNHYTGTVFPVNNQAVSVHGVKAYPSVGALPEPPDLVVVAVPAEQVQGVAEDALKAGTKGLMVVSSGFAEAGEHGAELQRKLVEAVRAHGARLVGPSCLGFMNTHPEVCLNASLAEHLPPHGRIGFYSHSGALGLVILQYATERGLGFSTFVSAGNRADVSGNDLLQYWEEDPLTDIALLYLEAFGNPRRFARIARRISYRKPVLCVKSARSRVGRDAAMAHTGTASQRDEEVDVLFQQAGVLRADTLEEMFDVAALLATQPLPQGNRVAVVSNSGGVVTITADACDASGLTISGPGLVDLGSMATADMYDRAVQEALEHAEVDSVIVLFACVGGCDPKPVARAIRRAAIRAERSLGQAKPVLLCLMGAAGAVHVAEDMAAVLPGPRRIFPSFRFPESAARALARAVQYAAYRRQPPGQILWYENVDAGLARRQVEELVANAAPGGPPIEATGEAAAKLLACFGVAVEEAGAGDEMPEGGGLCVAVRSHPDFGPLLGLGNQSRCLVERITPLTDSDAAGMVQAVGVTHGSPEIRELLGRLSQLIEELPWLWEMKARVIVRGSGEARRVVKLGADLRLGFRASSSRAR